jgi:radical SAM protein with 4Fe4S-binding SPASM domain
LEQIVQVMEAFDDLQGLRLLVSGGEPLLHPRFWEMNELFERFSFRTVLLSNGTLVDDPETASRLRVQEVQVSLDGVGGSHDTLRGPGTYERALHGLQNFLESGVDVSVATMVHAGNARDFDELEGIVRGLGAREWNIDVPARTGRWLRAGSLEARPDDVAAVLGRRFGGGSHFSCEGDWACGAHLCAVMADGTICKCGFYAHSPSGVLADGLANGWRNSFRMKLSQLRCDCEMIEQCRGGCRYRAETAGDRFGKDPIMCAANGVPYETSRRR